MRRGLALGLVLGLLVGSALTGGAQPQITGGGGAFFAGQAQFNSVCLDTTNKDTGVSRLGAASFVFGTCTQGDRSGTVGANLYTGGTASTASLQLATMGGAASVGVVLGSQGQTQTYTSGNGGFVSATQTFSPGAGSGNFAMVNLTPTINVGGAQTGTFWGYALAVIETALSGITVNLIDVGTTTSTLFSGYTSKFSVTDAGLVSPTLYGTKTRCANTGAPAVCAAAPAGSVVIAGAATSVVVNTTAVTANSQVLVQIDRSLGALLSVTCDTTSDLTTGSPAVTARSAGTSFTIAVPIAPAANPMCLSYFIIN